ncbi:MAG: double zinc ribbon domain-containing protein [Anaerolineae bacterium]
MKCPNCGNESQEDAMFCDQCGTRLQQPASVVENPVTVDEPIVPVVSEPQEAVCPNCGATNTPGEAFCSECGTPLAAPAPETDKQVAPQPREQVATAMAAAEPIGTGTKNCPSCGVVVVDGDEFCYACGADLRQPVATPTAQTQAEVAPEPVAQAAPAAPQPVTAETPRPVSAADTECPACGAAVDPTDSFCEFCGAALGGAQGSSAVAAAPVAPVVSAPPASSAPQVVPAPQGAPAVAVANPRLVVASSGVEIPLSSGSETVVGREDPYSNVYPNVDLTPHGGEEGGVSRRHFRILSSNGGYTIEDLNSTNFTLVNRERLQPGSSRTLSDGDEIRAGRVRLVFRVS